VNVDDLRQSKYLYVTGYLWDTENQKEAVLHAMREANAAGVKVALSLSDPSASAGTRTISAAAERPCERRLRQQGRGPRPDRHGQRA
jgi:sugar/nucleoside kinase (ribokinase family)